MGVVVGHLDVVKTEQVGRLGNQATTHLDRGLRRLRIDPSGVRDRHHQIQVAHGLAEHARRDVRDGKWSVRDGTFGELMDHMEAALGGVLGLGQSQRWLKLRDLAGSARRKSELGHIEDEVDAVFCAYLAWLWVNDPTSMRVYGDVASGYIVSPPPPTVPPRRGTAKGRVARVSERPASLAADLRKTNPRLTQQEADELAAVAAAYYGERR